MSISLSDDLHEVLKSVRTRPLFVMHLNVRKLQSLVRHLVHSSASALSTEARSRGNDFSARSWTGAATGRPCGATALQH